MRDSGRHSLKLPPEQQAIRDKCFHPSGTFVEFAKEEVEQSIPERFEKIVRLYPNRLAVKSRDVTLTYDALNNMANHVAQAILARRGEREEPVALLFGNDASMIVSILGTLKAGKIYVPLDPSHPRGRIFTIVDSLHPGLILTNERNSALGQSIARTGCEVLNIDEIDFSRSTNAPKIFVSPTSPAGILYTSGSTGQPKGVGQTHRNILLEITNYTNAVRICVADRLILVSSPSFGDAVRTTYGALLNGAALHPLDIKREGVAQLGQWMLEQEITIYRSVPSVFRQLVGTLTGREDFRNLRLIYSAGDSASWTDIESYKKHFSPNCLFVNGLGSMEALTFRWYFMDHATPVAGTSVPVGYPVKEKEVCVIDEDGHEAGFNRTGEIAVKSRYLSPGYWNRPDLTQAAYQSDASGGETRVYFTGDIGRMLPDGCLLHLGRKDFQVKVGGHRIEIAEIEAAMRDLDMIREVVVVAKEDQFHDRRLVAYLVANHHPVPTVTALRKALAEKLPAYMIPSSYVWLDALPLSPNGKIDRRALPIPATVRPRLDASLVAAGTALEQKLVEIWGEVLRIDGIGIHDDFFDLGGHSLAAMRVISRVIKEFRIEVPLRLLFQSPTVAEMAAVVGKHQANNIDNSTLHRILAELESLSDDEARRLASSQLKNHNR